MQLLDAVASSLILVACSGGPDSLALAAATADVAPGLGFRAGLITVDHDLQPGSATRAQDVASWGERRGLSPSEVVTVQVAGVGGVEAAARRARYGALDAAARRHRAVAVLLGHTEDDQAETVLLGLARGSGAMSLAGMARQRGLYRRPLLSISRVDTHSAAAEQDLSVWQDPHNADSRYARSRLRALLPELERGIGPGVVAGLARSARLLRADAEYLDALAADRRAAWSAPDGTMDVAALATAATAIRGRVLRGWLIDRGVSPGALTLEHVDRIDRLLTDWRGQGPVFLPGGLAAGRRAGRLYCVGEAMPG